MTDDRSPAVKQALLVRPMLESVAADLGRLPHRNDPRIVSSAIAQALVAIDELTSCSLVDPRHLDCLTRATTHTTTAAITLRAQPGGSQADALVRRLEQAHTALSKTRTPTIDAIVDAERKGTAEQALADFATGGVPMQASVGEPQLFVVRHKAAGAPRRYPKKAFDLGPAEAITDTSIIGTDARTIAALLQAAPDVQEASAMTTQALPASGRGHNGSVTSLRLRGWPAANEVPTDITPSGREGELGLLRRLMRDALEELGAMGNLRQVRGFDPWHPGVARFEQRLLNNLDVVIGLAEGQDDFDVLAEVRTYAGDGPIVDAGRAFAPVFVCGCIEGDIALRAAHERIRRTPEHLHDYVHDALMLASNPAVNDLAIELAASTDETLAVLGLDVLASRGGGSVAIAAPHLQHIERDVRAAAARALAFARDARAARDAVSNACELEVDDRVQAAMYRAWCLLDHDHLLPDARELLRLDGDKAQLGPRARHALVEAVALTGASADLALLLPLLERHPELALAASWHGHIDLVPLLLSQLQGSEPVYVTDTDAPGSSLPALALQRITGAELPMDAAASYYRPTTDAATWRNWWAAHSERFSTEVRYRVGEPFSLRMTIAELTSDLHIPMRVRQTLASELLIAGGVRINALDWRRRQLRQARQATDAAAERIDRNIGWLAE